MALTSLRLSGGLCGGRIGRLRRGCGRGFAAEDLKHHGSAGGAFTLNRLASVLHCFFDRIDDFLFCLTFDAVSFGHKKSRWPTLHAPGQLLEIAYWGVVHSVNSEKAAETTDDGLADVTICCQSGICVSFVVGSDLGGKSALLKPNHSIGGGNETALMPAGESTFGVD